VLDKLTTLDGLASWWTREVEGDPTAGGKVEFFFGRPDRSAAMEVVDVSHDGVVWNCIGGPEEWVGGVVTFDLQQESDETVLKFTQTWREPVDFMFHCSMKWAVFLISLKASLERGEGTPYPAEQQISSWS
jgi:hypothetical protein